MKTERGVLILSALMALIVGSAAVTAASITHSKAILLDGLFNLVYFLVALVTVRISALTIQPDDRKFPFGYGYFESLVNAGKGLLILGVSLFALGDAVLALFSGGRAIVAGPAILYALFATLTCSFTAWTLHRARARLDTPLVRADFENWLINSLISGSVLLTFCFIPVARWLGWHQIVPYVDSVLVIAVVLFCLGMPIRMARGALMELLNRAPPRTLRRPVRAAIDAALADLPVRQLEVRMVRPGRQLYVMTHVVLPADYPPAGGLAALDAIRERLRRAVTEVYPNTVTDTVFTADPRWAEPCEGGRGDDGVAQP
ncbi:cation transporter [Alcanivorax marinus]|uniref:Cation transporter n=1 Tax=Alloalcanivorax marinus TaxID=1177169 RepID=A0A9Q3YR62_9GAMM|nr:cation transporter [Alloalcanivorax marinus]MCC4310515.1 cation transporter [Alloalcanivorax marinus]